MSQSSGESNKNDLKQKIDAAWEKKDTLAGHIKEEVKSHVREALNLLDRGECRVAEKINGTWETNQWLKKAVLLSFRLNEIMPIEGGIGGGTWWDKTPSKFHNWSAEDFKQAGFRAVPPCAVRHSAYIAPEVVLMPSYVNMGAYIDRGAMIDTWATVGSCAQIGKNVHISGGAGIGGVLEPIQANPVIIEDGCFIGARAEVAEGVIVQEGAVLSMGVYIGASTKIIDRETGHIYQGTIPPYAVVVPGTLPPQSPITKEGKPAPSLYCAVIVKKVDAKTRAKTSINTLLREDMPTA